MTWTERWGLARGEIETAGGKGLEAATEHE